MAQRLGARGESVALLALLDTYPHRQYWPLSSWISVMARRARHQAALLRGMRPDAAVIRIRELWRSLLNHIRTRRGAHRFSAGAQGPQDEAAVSASLRRVLQAGIVASSRYRPRYFDGKITYLRAAIVDPLGLDDPASVWGRLARTLEIHTVAGDHKGMSTVHAESLAATLSVCIEEALEASERGAHDNGGSPFPAARDPLAAPPLPLVTRN
jgi:thioesterase domain-containing protein